MDVEKCALSYDRLHDIVLIVILDIFPKTWTLLQRLLSNLKDWHGGCSVIHTTPGFYVIKCIYTYHLIDISI